MQPCSARGDRHSVYHAGLGTLLVCSLKFMTVAALKSWTDFTLDSCRNPTDRPRGPGLRWDSSRSGRSSLSLTRDSVV